MTPSGFINKYAKISKSLRSQSFHSGIISDFETMFSGEFKEAALNSILSSGEISERDHEIAKEFVNTFYSEIKGNSLRFILYAITSKETSISQESVNDLTNDDIEEWVRAGFKNKRDGVKFDNNVSSNAFGKVITGIDLDEDEVIRKMQGILVRSKDSSVTLSEKQIAAQKKYSPWIKRFIEMQQVGIYNNSFDKWSKAVLVTWVKLAKKNLPIVAAAHLRDLIHEY